MNKPITEVQAKDPFWQVNQASRKRSWQVTKAFARRDLSLRYVQTRMGWLWVIAQPLLAAALVLLVFSVIVKVEIASDVPYALYAFAALPGWLMAQSILLQGGPSLVHNQHILRKIAFPKMALIQAKGLVFLVDFLVASILFIAFAYGLYGSIPQAPLLWVFMLAYTWLLATGMAALVAAWSVKYRDLIAILPFLAQGLFLLTPVAYPSARYADALGAWDWVLYLNPFVSMAEGFRLAFFGIGDLAELHVPGITLSFAMGCLLIFFGRLALQWVDRNLVDRL